MIGWITALLYVGMVFAANWAILRFGFVPVGFGLLAPAGVYFAGLAFTLRDLTHEALGRRAVLAVALLWFWRRRSSTLAAFPAG